MSLARPGGSNLSVCSWLGWKQTRQVCHWNHRTMTGYALGDGFCWRSGLPVTLDGVVAHRLKSVFHWVWSIMPVVCRWTLNNPESLFLSSGYPFEVFCCSCLESSTLNVSDRPAALRQPGGIYIFPRVDDTAIGIIRKSSPNGVPCQKIGMRTFCRQTMPGYGTRMLWAAFCQSVFCSAWTLRYSSKPISFDWKSSTFSLCRNETGTDMLEQQTPQ